MYIPNRVPSRRPPWLSVFEQTRSLNAPGHHPRHFPLHPALRQILFITSYAILSLHALLNSSAVISISFDLLSSISTTGSWFFSFAVTFFPSSIVVGSGNFNSRDVLVFSLCRPSRVTGQSVFNRIFVLSSDLSRQNIRAPFLSYRSSGPKYRRMYDGD
jgi:hypothetical protein